MEAYILKSAACLAILLFFYKAVLERENMHVFKRFYLLFTLMVSAIIPLISFKTYVAAPATSEVIFKNTSEYIKNQVSEGLVFNYSYLIFAIYTAGILFFSIKFSRNLYELFNRIHKNPKFNTGSSIQVLLKEKLPPHTFFQYIFLNKNEFENNTIPKEVLKHEEAHSKQKHSLDIILLEVFQIMAWFNPLVYFLKKSVKLNHEFLADSAVLRSGVNAQHYQHTLLNFSSKDLHSTLVNPINYSSIKKRLTVMKTTTSQPVLWLKIVLILPVLALICYGFTGRETIYVAPAELKQPEVASRLKKVEPIPQIISEYSGAIQKSDSVKPKKATKEMMEEYNALAKKYNAQENASAVDIDYKDVERMHYLYQRMSLEQRRNAEPFPVAIAPPAPPAPPAPSMSAPHPAIAQVREQQRELERVEMEQDRAMRNQERQIRRQEIEMQRRERNIQQNRPVPPPPPPSPAEHMQELANNGAVFFYEGKKISSKKAIEIVKDSHHIQIQVTQENSEKPVVRISESDVNQD